MTIKDNLQIVSLIILFSILTSSFFTISYLMYNSGGKDWTTYIAFNRYGEGLVECIIVVISFMILIYWSYKCYKLDSKKWKIIFNLVR